MTEDVAEAMTKFYLMNLSDWEVEGFVRKTLE
jgi:hypothetical protein